MNKTNITLRWIGVLPCAAIAAFVAQFIATGIFSIAYKFGFNPEENSGLILSYTIPFFIQVITGYSFVFAGTWCAPAKHREVAFGLAILTSLASIMTLIMSGYYDNALNYVIVGGRIAGAVWGVLKFKNSIEAEAI